jgi:hypothetical protein
MAHAGKRVSDKLRAAILGAPVTRYRIAKDAGVGESILSKFVNRKTGLDGATIDVLAEYLGLELIERKKGR